MMWYIYLFFVNIFFILRNIVIFIYCWIFAQIVLEMLPISSSSHLAILQSLFKKYFSFDVNNYFADKKIAIKPVYYYLHFPTLFIVLLYFGKHWLSLVFHDSIIDPTPIIWVMIADIITVLLYIMMHVIRIPFSIRIGFFITAMALFSTAWCAGGQPIIQWHYSDAIILGLAQGIALLPGISRLAFTCAAGCWLGFSLIDAFCLSWLIQAPLMFAAFAKSIKDLLQTGRLHEILNLPMSLAMLVSGGISYAVFLLVVSMINLHILYFWGWYMIVPFVVWGWLKRVE